MGLPKRRQVAALQISDRPYFTFAHTTQFHSESAERLAARLLALAPRNFRPGGRVWFTSGGSEATETAIKLARQYYLESNEPARYRVPVITWPNPSRPRWRGRRWCRARRRLRDSAPGFPGRRDPALWGQAGRGRARISPCFPGRAASGGGPAGAGLPAGRRPHLYPAFRLADGLLRGGRGDPDGRGAGLPVKRRASRPVREARTG